MQQLLIGKNIIENTDLELSVNNLKYFFSSRQVLNQGEIVDLLKHVQLDSVEEIPDTSISLEENHSPWNYTYRRRIRWMQLELNMQTRRLKGVRSGRSSNLSEQNSPENHEELPMEESWLSAEEAFDSESDLEVGANGSESRKSA
ncbi:hypothetical protein WA026_014501 [Henosepilachna vigintioctopunctata]|uniref:Uncharacterized protein n=1 Tax=Henosepilachna vigintioctopunctata TaxID=420089 RepID=A0AAW1UDT5_9CUCU